MHSDATDAVGTDWPQIVALYDQLLVVQPTPLVRLHRAVAVAEVDGPLSALRIVDGLDLPQHHLFHAVRADLLRRLGRAVEAAQAYRRAVDLSGNAVERRFLSRRLAALPQ